MLRAHSFRLVRAAQLSKTLESRAESQGWKPGGNDFEPTLIPERTALCSLRKGSGADRGTRRFSVKCRTAAASP